MGRDRPGGRHLDSAGFADEGRARAPGAAIRRALEVLDGARGLADGSGLVFTSQTGKQLSDSTLSTLLRGLGVDAVAHGFRSSFRDWAAECTDTPHAVMEAALAHAVRDKAEAAYARSDLFERRRKLMEQWASYLAQGRSEVAPTVPRHG